ncbi:hypothetical protein Moror_17752 [Moniliophthora roreri MCA 2997]|uniref:DUF6593 domain-containing protein n=1 Tax=Moniliophthora roreri (strain MCA 2997) TaxID=1381753 RepID=V2XWS5_MONRO|nr:hypothetical protein Moror_17752 [Moniliophthora roreri MCA 2997]
MPAEALTLILTPNNPCNTRLSDSNSGKVLYEVATERGKDTVTKVKRASDNQTVASWVWRNIRSDVITFGNASPMPSSAWLKKSLIPFRDTVTFEDSSKRTFKWKGYGPSLALELFSESDKNRPIARFLKPALLLNEEGKLSGEWTPARLILDERAEEIQDLVVVSFLMLEKSRREAESSARIRTQISSYSVTPAIGL